MLFRGRRKSISLEQSKVGSQNDEAEYYAPTTYLTTVFTLVMMLYVVSPTCIHYNH